MITVQQLRKVYGAHEAVKGISFSVAEGALFAFLGTNGAGKSTTIEILCTLLAKTSGDVTINGYTLNHANEAHIRKSIGVVFQQSLLDERLTVEENILHRGKLYGMTKQELHANYAFVTSALQLTDIAQKRYKSLSGGQKRRADIARALIHRPKILFLDEPTTGLDPQTRQFVWAAVRRLQQEENMTIFLTTHYMEEAAVADHVVVLKEGHVVAQGTPEQLKAAYAYDSVRFLFTKQAQGLAQLQALGVVYEASHDVVTVRVRSTLEGLQLVKTVEPLLESFEMLKGTMDDVFIHIMEETT